MSQYRIAVAVGSLRRDSFNRKLANAMTKLGPKEFSFKFLEIGDLPLYNQDDDDVPTLGQPEAFIQVDEGLFDDEGGIGDDSREFLQGWMDKYVDWVKEYAV
ncbi:MAG: NAD(P)H-dependent oxidoreductase [Woeseiaceae bacterium]